MLKSVKGGGITYDPRKGKITIDGEDYKNLVRQIEKKERIKYRAPLSSMPPREPLDVTKNAIEIDGKCSDMGPYVACNAQKAQEAGLMCPNPQYALFPYTIEKKTGSLCYPKMNFNKVHQDEKMRQRAKARQAILQLIKVLAAFNDEDGTPEMCDVINKMTKQPPQVRQAYCDGLVSTELDDAGVATKRPLCTYDVANEVCESLEKKKVPLGLSREEIERLKQLKEAKRKAEAEGKAEEAKRIEEELERELEEAKERARLAREEAERRNQLQAAQARASAAFRKTQGANLLANTALTEIRSLRAPDDIVSQVEDALRAVKDAVQAASNSSDAANDSDDVDDAEREANAAENAATEADAAARAAQDIVTQQRQANEAAEREARAAARVAGERARAEAAAARALEVERRNQLQAAQARASAAFRKTQGANLLANTALTQIQSLRAPDDIVEQVRGAVKAVQDAVQAARNASDAADDSDDVVDAGNAASNAESAAKTAEEAARIAQSYVTRQRQANDAAEREARANAARARNPSPRQEQRAPQPRGRGRGASPRPSGPAPGFPKTVTDEGIDINISSPEQERYLNQVLRSNEYQNTKTFIMKGTRASDDQVASFKNALQNLASNIQLLVNDDEVSLYKNTFQQIMSPAGSGGVGGAPGSSSQGSVGQTAASGVASSSAGLTTLQKGFEAANSAYE